MAGIVFKKVRMKNFLSVGNMFLEYDLDQKGSSILIGKNGCGKSLLLDALCFSLYGKSYRGVNKPGLVNSVNECESVVEIEFETMGKKYKIIRGQKPSIFEIYQNGVMLNQDSKAKDYQEYLETNILKMNFKSFTQVIVLGATNYTPFMKLTAQHRRDVIEDLLDIQIFSNMRKVLKEFISDNNSSIADHEGRVNIIEEKIAIQKKHIKTIQNKKEENTEEKQEELTEAKKQVADISEEISEMEFEIAAKMDSAENQNALSTSIRDMNKIHTKISSKLSRFKDIEEFYTNGGDCPTCKQEIDMDFADNLLLEQNKSVSELDEAIVEINEELKTLDERLSVVKEVENEIRKLQSLISERNGKISGLNRYISSLNTDIEKNSEGATDVQEYKDKLEEYTKDIETLQDDKKELAAYRNSLKTVEMILKDNGIKSKIIKEYLPQMNGLINKYLTALDFFVEFTLDENFKETVKSRFRDDFSYESFSEGQKFRINIAILFAWRDIAKLKNSAHTNILVLDEVFDSSLDSDGVDEFMKLLKAVTEDGVHIMVISHRGDSIIDKFDRVYQVVQKKGYTTVSLT